MMKNVDKGGAKEGKMVWDADEVRLSRGGSTGGKVVQIASTIADETSEKIKAIFARPLES